MVKRYMSSLEGPSLAILQERSVIYEDLGQGLVKAIVRRSCGDPGGVL